MDKNINTTTSACWQGVLKTLTATGVHKSKIFLLFLLPRNGCDRPYPVSGMSPLNPNFRRSL